MTLGHLKAYLSLHSTSTLIISSTESPRRDNLFMLSKGSLISVSKTHEKPTKHRNKTKIDKHKRREKMLEFIANNWLDLKKDTTTDEEFDKRTNSESTEKKTHQTKHEGYEEDENKKSVSQTQDVSFERSLNENSGNFQATPSKLNSSKRRSKNKDEIAGFVNEFQKRRKTSSTDTTLESETEHLISEYLVQLSSKKEKQEKKNRLKKKKERHCDTPSKSESNKNITGDKNSSKITLAICLSSCNDSSFNTKRKHENVKKRKSGDDIIRDINNHLSDTLIDFHKKVKHKSKNGVDEDSPQTENIKKSPEKPKNQDENEPSLEKPKKEVSKGENKDVEEFDPETRQLLSILENSSNDENDVNEENTKHKRNGTYKDNIKEPATTTKTAKKSNVEKEKGEVSLQSIVNNENKDTNNLNGEGESSSVEKKIKKLKRSENKTAEDVRKNEKNTDIKDQQKRNSDERRSFDASKLEEIEKRITQNDEFDFSFSDIEDMLEQTLEEDEEKTIKNSEKLKTLHIVLPFEVPMSHKIETRFTYPMTEEQILQAKELDIKYKSGCYSAKENETIKENFKEFCKLHDLEHDAEPFLNIKNIAPEERANFVKFLGRNLENRQLYSIYRRFKTMYTETKKGNFTPNENAIIMKFMETNKNKTNPFVKLGKLLKRDPLAILKHYSSLKEVKVDHHHRKNVLDEKKLEEFLRNLQEVTLFVDIDELKDRPVKKDEWDEISRRMGMPAEVLKNTWRRTIHPKIFVKTTYGKIAKDVLLRLYDMNVRDWREVQWDEIAKHFDGCNQQFLRRLIYKITCRLINKEYYENARKCIKYLLKIDENNLLLVEPKRIMWKRGELSFYKV